MPETTLVKYDKIAGHLRQNSFLFLLWQSIALASKLCPEVAYFADTSTKLRGKGPETIIAENSSRLRVSAFIVNFISSRLETAPSVMFLSSKPLPASLKTDKKNCRMMIKKILGIAPTPTEDGAFRPSSIALKLATSQRTDFDGTIYQTPYEGGKLKVLMVCTEERNMTMANGKKFSTGNHPVEMMLPMLHLKNAGFDIDIVTPTGKSVKIEMWAMPKEDENVKAVYSEYKEQFDNPKSLSDFVKNSMNDNSDYIAIFIPGGHGAMLGLPENPDLSKLIHWSYKKDLFMLAICHGPAALLAANLASDEDPFIYKGYKIAAFPDAVDKQTPLIGYMPGHMPWKFGERLNELGVTIINKKADKTCHIDRKLISGAGPKAANDFGKLAATELLKEINKVE